MADAATAGNHATVDAPAPPKELEREPLVANNRSLGWISDKVAGVAEGVESRRPKSINSKSWHSIGIPANHYGIRPSAKKFPMREATGMEASPRRRR